MKHGTIYLVVGLLLFLGVTPGYTQSKSNTDLIYRYERGEIKKPTRAEKKLIEDYIKGQEKVAPAGPPRTLSSVVFINENFSTATGTTPPAGWTQNIITGEIGVDLWHFDNPEPRTLNPPITTPAAIFDSDNYSNNSQAEDVALESPVFNATSAPVVTLAWDQHFQGGFGGEAIVEVFNGTSWVSVFSTTVSTTNPNSQSINISAHVAGVSNAQVRFRWTGDFSWWWIIDNVVVQEPASNDMSATGFINPINGGVKSPNIAFTPVATFKNLGGVAATCNVKYEIVGTAYTSTKPVTALAAGDTINVTFDPVAGGLSAGVYTIRAISLLGGDANAANDTLTGTLNVALNTGDYTFAQTSGTYTPITGGTLHSTSFNWDDTPNFTAIPIGFTFNFNGFDYTTVSIAMNGFITFGGTAPGTTNYTPISAVTAYSGAISGFGRDLQGVAALGAIRSESSGGVYTVQWSHARRYFGATANTEDFEFQIKLYQTTNKIEIVYGTFSDADTATNALNPQVGLRGATNGDFNNRVVLSGGAWASSTLGTSNTDTAYYHQNNPGVKPASGLTYTFTPPVVLSPPNCAVPVSPADSAINVLASAVLNWASGGGGATGYRLSFGTDNPPTNIVNNVDLGAVLSYDPSPDMAFNQTYYWKVVAYNGNGNAAGCGVWRFTTGPDPAITSFPYTQGFESLTFPPFGWANMTAKLWSRGSESHSGTGAARSIYTPAGTSILQTPNIVLPAGHLVKFWWKDDDISAAPQVQGFDTTYFEVSTNGGTSWTTLSFLSQPDETFPYEEVVIDLSPYAGPTTVLRWRDVTDGTLSAWGVGVDDIFIGPPAAFDMSLDSWMQTTGLPTPSPSGHIAYLAPQARKLGKADAAVLQGITNGSHAVEGELVAPIGDDGAKTEALSPVTVRSIAENLGLNASTYSLQWKVNGVAQTPYAGPSVPVGLTDTANVVYAGADRGTFYAQGYVVAAGDADPNNDTLGARLRIYPDSFDRTIYDRGDNTVDTYVGWGSLVTAMKAGVRFTASATRRLAGVDFICTSEAGAVSGVWTVQVRDAGTLTAPGPVLYTRTYSGIAYNAAQGDYMTFAFDASAPVISIGNDYWITVKAPLGIEYPGAVHNTGFTTGRSFYEDNVDTTLWSPLVITTERAWIMRSYDVDNSTITTTPLAGWNIISNPVQGALPDDSVRTIFGSQVLTSYGFKFVPGAGYQQESEMSNGVGYWAKFPASPSSVVFNDVFGTPLSALGVSVAVGWNLIGSIAAAVETSDVNMNSTPPGIVISNYYGYGLTGYGSGDDQLLPGKGYWVKSSAAGTLTLVPPAPARPSPTVKAAATESPLSGLNTVTIRDAQGHVQTLHFGVSSAVSMERYELPPPPPAGLFDARFVSDNAGYAVQIHGAEAGATFPVAIQSSAYPLTVEWNITSGTYELSDAATHRTITGTGSMQITNSAVSQLALRLTGSGELPREFALNQNYPNPFNPTTNIAFALPVDSRVTMEIYNALGQRVRTLVNGNQPAGYHVAEWNGTGNANQVVGSGVYFVRLNATGVDGRSFTNLRKMVLMK